MTKEEYLADIIPRIDQAYAERNIILLKYLANELNSSMAFVDEYSIQAYAKSMEFFLDNDKMEGFCEIYANLKKHVNGKSKVKE